MNMEVVLRCCVGQKLAAAFKCKIRRNEQLTLINKFIHCCTTKNDRITIFNRLITKQGYDQTKVEKKHNSKKSLFVTFGRWPNERELAKNNTVCCIYFDEL